MLYLQSLPLIEARHADYTLYTILGVAGGQVLHIINVYILPTCAAPKSKIWDKILTYLDSIPPNEMLFLVGNFSTHLLGVYGLAAMHCPFLYELRH